MGQDSTGADRAGGDGLDRASATPMTAGARGSPLSGDDSTLFSRRWAHDLRAPLTGISGFASLIAESDDITKIQAWADRIMVAADRLEMLLSELSTELDAVERGDRSAGPPAATAPDGA